MKVILHYIKPFIPRMSVGISFKFIGAVMELLLPWILSYLIDDIVPLRQHEDRIRFHERTYPG